MAVACSDFLALCLLLLAKLVDIAFWIAPITDSCTIKSPLTACTVERSTVLHSNLASMRNVLHIEQRFDYSVRSARGR